MTLPPPSSPARTLSSSLYLSNNNRFFAHIFSLSLSFFSLSLSLSLPVDPSLFDGKPQTSWEPYTNFVASNGQVTAALADFLRWPLTVGRKKKSAAMQNAPVPLRRSERLRSQAQPVYNNTKKYTKAATVTSATATVTTATGANTGPKKKTTAATAATPTASSTTITGVKATVSSTVQGADNTIGVDAREKVVLEHKIKTPTAISTTVPTGTNNENATSAYVGSIVNGVYGVHEHSGRFVRPQQQHASQMAVQPPYFSHYPIAGGGGGGIGGGGGGTISAMSSGGPFQYEMLGHPSFHLHPQHLHHHPYYYPTHMSMHGHAPPPPPTHPPTIATSHYLQPLSVPTSSQTPSVFYMQQQQPQIHHNNSMVSSFAAPNRHKTSSGSISTATTPVAATTPAAAASAVSANTTTATATATTTTTTAAVSVTAPSSTYAAAAAAVKGQPNGILKTVTILVAAEDSNTAKDYQQVMCGLCVTCPNVSLLEPVLIDWKKAIAPADVVFAIVHGQDDRLDGHFSSTIGSVTIDSFLPFFHTCRHVLVIMQCYSGADMLPHLIKYKWTNSGADGVSGGGGGGAMGKKYGGSLSTVSATSLRTINNRGGSGGPGIFFVDAGRQPFVVAACINIILHVLSSWISMNEMSIQSVFKKWYGGYIFSFFLYFTLFDLAFVSG